MNKKEANVLMKEYLDKLLQKQMINQSTYDKAVKKFAAGGVVVDPLAVIEQAEKTPQVSTPIMTPQEQALFKLPRQPRSRQFFKKRKSWQCKAQRSEILSKKKSLRRRPLGLNC
jgi:crotonobetainyl-CoA:carnitine CoA-transferase CaiB-like acyl-CoA transferase